MILVTGMTGSGKSTTVASLVDWINQNKSLHVLCIEEPVEYVHANKRSVVSQRDVGVDIATFHEAVRGALRHDPDVIVIGEMRDPDTIRSAINAAATGHLVISTLHSSTVLRGGQPHRQLLRPGRARPGQAPAPRRPEVRHLPAAGAPDRGAAGCRPSSSCSTTPSTSATAS